MSVEGASYSFAYTRAVLAAWGRWSVYRVGGYPSQSAHVPRVRGRSPVPEGVLATDLAIASLGIGERHLQKRLIVHYHRDCGIRDLLRRLRLSTRCYYDQLEEAQWAVHVRLLL